MAGILLYTAAPDSEGTLGGLVGLAENNELEGYLTAVLQNAQLCANDPLCAEKLKSRMQPGPVYRRKDLAKFSAAVDRDLNSLVEHGEVEKLGAGLYSRRKSNAFGFSPPDDWDLVRAFLKTDDFLLHSYNNFTQLGLGLTQVYNTQVVYNHKRSGLFRLGGKPFFFRVVPSYPKKLTREFLLVDMANNLKKLPDNTDRVVQNLKAHKNEFNKDKVKEYLDRYGRPAARELLEEVYA